MITQKPVSGVCFCTYAELRSALVGLKNIDFWMAIEHLPEDQENEGKKLHCHFLLVPAGRIDTISIREHLPHCLPLRSSKEFDWFLYSLHNEAYLLQHGLTKEHTYTLKEMQTSLDNSRDFLQGFYNQAIESLSGVYNRVKAVKQMARSGLDWSVVLASGVIPPNQFQFYKELYMQFFTHNPNN